jgi:hypothetical protein
VPGSHRTGFAPAQVYCNSTLLSFPMPCNSLSQNRRNGRYCEATGSCDVNEKRFSKPNNDIPATAETRAKTRAVQVPFPPTPSFEAFRRLGSRLKIMSADLAAVRPFTGPKPDICLGNSRSKLASLTTKTADSVLVGICRQAPSFFVKKHTRRLFFS